MRAEKPDLAWIHGLGRSKNAILPYAQALLPDVHCLATDLLGHGGRLPIPATLSTEAFAADLLQSYDRAGLRNPYLVGWSYGGRVALHLALHHPERVRGVCLLGTSFEQRTALEVGLRYYDPHRSREEPLGGHKLKLYPAIHSWLTSQREAPTVLTEDYLKGVQCPVLIFSGTHDPIVPTADAEALHSLLPRSRLSLFEGSIHPTREHPDRDVPLDILRREILQFVEDVEAGTFPQVAPASFH